MYCKTKAQAEREIVEATTGKYASVHKLVILGPDSDGEYEVKAEKVCGTCNQVWHTRELYAGCPSERCPTCRIAAEDKLRADTKKNTAASQYQMDRLEAYN